MSIGNVQAIRDWINTNYYSKQEIIDKFAVEYSCNIRGGSNETITITNPTLDTIQTVTTRSSGQTSEFANQAIKIKALPGDTISLKGSLSNQTFTYTFGLNTDFANNYIYCMPPRTIMWYGNIVATNAGNGNLTRVSGTGSINNVYLSNNNTGLPRSYFGIKGANVASNIDYGQYPQVWKTVNPIDFDDLGINSKSTNLKIVGEHVCPSTDEGYKKNLTIRFGEELNNCSVYLCKDIAIDAPDGAYFSANISGFPVNTNASGSGSTLAPVSGANSVITNYSKPLTPSYVYFIFDTKALVGNPVNNYIAISELYFI